MSSKDPPPPFIAPGVNDPRAINYAKRIQAASPRYGTPRGGAASPPIPRLDMPAQEGMTIADHAMAGTRGPSILMNPPQRQPGQPMPQLPQLPDRQGLQLLPGDILPHEATQDPAFQQGMGSNYATSQPHLAARYGVIRNGQKLTAQQLSTGKTGLSNDTLAGLQAIQSAQETQQKKVVEETVSQQDQEVETKAKEGVLGAMAASAGSKREAEEQTETSQVDGFTLSRVREMSLEDELSSQEQRKIVEDRLQPLNLGDLILHGRIQQRVPIHPGVFEPTFQSLSASDELKLRELITQEARTVDLPEQYLKDRYSVMGVTAGLVKINDAVFPSHVDSNGAFDATAFWQKFNKVSQYPWHLIASLAVNFFWFEIRVRKLFVAARLKNG